MQLIETHQELPLNSIMKARRQGAELTPQDDEWFDDFKPDNCQPQRVFDRERDLVEQIILRHRGFWSGQRA